MKRNVFFSTVMASDGDSVYRVPQINIVAHGAEHVDAGVDDGEVTKWVRQTINKSIICYCKNKKCL